MHRLSLSTVKLSLPNSRGLVQPGVAAAVHVGLQALAVFAAFAALFAAVQYATPGLADHDGYYHLRMAQLMREQGLTPDFVWLPLSILNSTAYYDHHLLYHAYLSIFAGRSDPAELIAGAKLASASTIAVAIAPAALLRPVR